MARTTLTVQVAPGAYSTGSSFAWRTASSATGASGNQFILTGAELLVMHFFGTATGGATGQPVHLVSVNDQFNRVAGSTAGILTIALTEGAGPSIAGPARMIGPMKTAGWIQSDGKFYLDGGSSKVRFAIVKIPGL